MEEFGGLGGLSATAILLVLVLREIFSYLKAKDAQEKKADPEDPDCAREIEEQLKMIRESQARTATNCEKITEILSAKDADGLPLVYTPRSLGKSIESLSQSIVRLSDQVQGQ
jgi:hypothetical protein